MSQKIISSFGRAHVSRLLLSRSIETSATLNSKAANGEPKNLQVGDVANGYKQDSTASSTTGQVQSRRAYYYSLIALSTAGIIWYLVPTNFRINLYKMLPLRMTSTLWGKLNSYDLPNWIRPRIYDFFCRTYNCDISEAIESDYKSYRNLGAFFSRRIKPDSRPISQEPGVVSPADGLIVHLGPIENGQVEDVKGLNYSIQAFLGLKNNSDDDNYDKQLLQNPDKNQLYHCVIYLAPGDYHGFHSPTSWQVEYRKHFPGSLLSVRPSLIRRAPEVLSINERVCYFGNWKHGFFSMTAVGATNVGSIKVNFDEELRTNRTVWDKQQHCFEHKFNNSVRLSAGQDFGEFNFGSTIVLIFEAPKRKTKQIIGESEKIKFGQLLARIE